MDITERKRTDERLRYLSSHDVLTDLYNRTYFDEALARSGDETRFPASVLVIDIDGMKQTNDTQGHAAGDELLRRTATVLRAALDKASTLARTSGDEFAALLTPADTAMGV